MEPQLEHKHIQESEKDRKIRFTRSTITVIVFAILILAVLNYLIYQKEEILKSGKTILLELAPRDPRSLMQGDYMELQYKIVVDLENTGYPLKPEFPTDGKLVLGLDKNGVGSFKRYFNGETLGVDESLLRYRKRPQTGIKLGAESFLFQEGQAERFAPAKYGELKVSPAGECILVGLRDKELKRL